MFGPKGGYAIDHWPESSNVTPVIPRIRQAVKTAFTFDPAEQAARDAIANEYARVWVLDGAHDGHAGDVADYLDFQGIAASAPNQRVTGPTLANTVIKVYNGSEADQPKTVKLLEDTFGVTAQLVTDPKVKVDIIITTGNRTPNLSAPSLP